LEQKKAGKHAQRNWAKNAAFSLLERPPRADGRKNNAFITRASARGLVCAAFAPDFAGGLACLFVAGIGYSTAQPGGSKSVSAWFRSTQLGLAMGIRQAGLPIGGAAAAAVLPYITNITSWRLAFEIGAAVALSGGLAFALAYRRPVRPRHQARPIRHATTLPYLVAMLCQPWMRRVVWSGVALVSAQFGILTYLMFFLRDRQGIPLTRGAWALFLAQLFGVAGRVILAAWSDHSRVGRLRPVLASMVAVAAGLLALVVVPAHTPVTVLVIIAGWIGFFGFGWYGPWVAHITEASPPESVGLALGTAMAANQIAIVTTPPLLGLLLDVTGTYTALWGALAVLLAVAAWLTRLPFSKTRTHRF